MKTKVVKKGVKAIMLDLKADETHLFGRRQYSNVRSSMSIARIEYPERDWFLDIVDNGIKVTCVS